MPCSVEPDPHPGAAQGGYAMDDDNDEGGTRHNGAGGGFVVPESHYVASGGTQQGSQVHTTSVPYDIFHEGSMAASPAVSIGFAEELHLTTMRDMQRQVGWVFSGASSGILAKAAGDMGHEHRCADEVEYGPLTEEGGAVGESEMDRRTTDFDVAGRIVDVCPRTQKLLRQQRAREFGLPNAEEGAISQPQGVGRSTVAAHAGGEEGTQ
ncbi:hypothetical protein CBR_g3391 [Chara braunii]|uniref:Uncharacterized protein n=1 Tax=Chara braunii TaxID=69332 RepID=A0A388JQV7_CHABU|nr:hypothetical protein CBR_g3391 [Chara braunii]|eukprot:GBG60148.1 hypothetical protein CBR_g3391 [Chara braunii]